MPLLPCLDGVLLLLKLLQLHIRITVSFLYPFARNWSFGVEIKVMVIMMSVNGPFLRFDGNRLLRNIDWGLGEFYIGDVVS